MKLNFRGHPVPSDQLQKTLPQPMQPSPKPMRADMCCQLRSMHGYPVQADSNSGGTGRTGRWNRFGIVESWYSQLWRVQVCSKICCIFFRSSFGFLLPLIARKPKKKRTPSGRTTTILACKSHGFNSPASVNLRPRRLPSNSQDICQGVRLLTPDSSTASPLPKWIFFPYVVWRKW